MTKKTATSRYDVAEHLRTAEEMAAYLEACFEEADGDAAFVAKALGDIARAKGMSQVARDAGLSRESLYKALSGERSPDFDVVPVASSSSLTAAALGGARAVVFLSTTGELRMGTSGLRRLLAWIADGGAFVGLHAATNTFANEPQFARMLGAQFEAHPFVGRGRVLVSDRKHPATRGLPSSFVIDDEFYVFKTGPRRRAHVLARRATKRDEPLVWWRREGRGRVFYSALGHPNSAWRDPHVLRLVAGGLRWAVGSANRGDAALEQRRHRSPGGPRRYRFRAAS